MCRSLAQPSSIVKSLTDHWLVLKHRVQYYSVEPPNNGQVWDEHSVRCSEVVSSSEVEMYVGRR